MAQKRSKGEEHARVKKFLSATNENVIVNPLHCYRLIEFFVVFIALSDILICRS